MIEVQGRFKATEVISSSGIFAVLQNPNINMIRHVEHIGWDEVWLEDPGA